MTTTTLATEEWVSAEKAAKILGCTTQAVAYHARQGHLDAVMGAGTGSGKYKIRLASVHEYKALRDSSSMKRDPLSSPSAVPAGTNWAWAEEAACKGMPLELFYVSEQRQLTVAQQARFQTAFGHIPTRDTVVAWAVAVCKSCPVREACLAHGIASNEPGIWGGKTRYQRTALRKKGVAA